ncbi:phosphoribosylformylglycinamidine synthase II, partial [Methanosarcinales archaeon]
LSSTPDEDRPSVQIGDPYTEKLIIEATLEAMDRGIVEACKDLGAAGLAGASSEMAAGGGLGIRIFADAVPLREKGLTTYEILLAESQERMIIEVRPENVEEIAEIARKYDIAFGVVGVLTQEKKFVVEHNGEVVVDLPMDLLVGGAPPYDRKARKRRAYIPPLTLTEVSDYRNAILKILSSPNVAFKDWVFRQYDHEVQIRTHVKPGEDCGVLLDPMCEHMIALSCGCNPRHVALNPYEGTKLSIIENSSNLAVVGAEPICIVNCLNFGNPEDEEVYWDFRESVRGLGDGAREIGVPVVGGNVSFYNESEEFGTEVLPTPSIGMVGILPRMRVPSMYLSEGDSIVLVGATYDEMLGSEFYGCYGVLSESNAPKFRSEYVNNIKKVREVVREGIVNSAHDLSIGGLAVGICKMALKCGAEVRLESNSGTLNTLLFSETYGRFVLGVEEELVDEVLSKTGGQVIGKAGGGRIKINDILLDLSDVQTALSSLTKTMIGDENERK